MGNGEVINLDDYRPHIEGKAKCLSCGNTWHAVAEVGTVELCCQECGTWKGVFVGMVAPETVWECRCGNRHFYLSPDGATCSRCGVMVMQDE